MNTIQYQKAGIQITILILRWGPCLCYMAGPVDWTYYKQKFWLLQQQLSALHLLSHRSLGHLRPLACWYESTRFPLKDISDLRLISGEILSGHIGYIFAWGTVVRGAVLPSFYPYFFRFPILFLLWGKTTENFQHFSPGCISPAPTLLTALQAGAKGSGKGGDEAGDGNLQHPCHHRPLHASLPPAPPLPLPLQAGHLQRDCHLPRPHGDHHNHHWLQSQWRCQLQDQRQPTYWKTILDPSQEEKKSVAQFYPYVDLINQFSLFNGRKV